MKTKILFKREIDQFNLIIFFFIFCSIFETHAQHGQFFLGEVNIPTNSTECSRIIKCSNNTSVIIGQSLYTPGKCFITKIDSVGNIIWFNFVADDSMGYETVTSDGIKTLDNGFLIVGYSTLHSTSDDNAQVFKLDSLGNFQWAVNYAGNDMDRANTAIQMEDSSYVISGVTQSVSANSRLLIFKLDKNGHFLWGKAFNTAGYAISSTRTSDGGYVIGNSGSGVQVLKFNSVDSLLWTTAFSTLATHKYLSAQEIIETSDHGFAFAGSYLHTIYSSDNLIAKLDSNGNLLWNQLIDIGLLDGLSSLKETNDSGLVAVGGTDNTGFNPGNGYIVKVDRSGNFLWGKIIGESCFHKSIIINEDKGFSIIGNSRDYGNPNSLNIYLGKLDSLGHNCSNFVNKGSVYTDTLSSYNLAIFSTPAIFLFRFNGMDTITSFYSIAICTDNSIQTNETEIKSEERIYIFPNPARNILNISQENGELIQSIKIFNSIGQKQIVNYLLDKNVEYLELDISSLSPGLYFLELITDKQKFVNHFIKE